MRIFTYFPSYESESAFAETDADISFEGDTLRIFSPIWNTETRFIKETALREYCNDADIEPKLVDEFITTDRTTCEDDYEKFEKIWEALG